MKFNEPLSRHTSWRVGGPADKFYVPRDREDLKTFLGQLPEDEPLTLIGLGSNLLVRDAGIRGTVIAVKNVMDELEETSPGEIMAGAGVSCARIARYSVQAGLTGAEFLIGIPGTFGGALAMNAGAFGAETWNIVSRVETVNRRGETFNRVRSDFRVGYRSVSGTAGEWFLSAHASLKADTGRSGASILREFLDRRAETQPIGKASCGSVFRNPAPDQPAARLIESCGLKGRSVGKACISTKHANFIINSGGATAEDIERLIHIVQEAVYEKHKVTLAPEVCFIGDGG